MYPVHRWQTFAKLTTDEREALATLARNEMTYSAGRTIRSEGDTASGFYLHVGGWIASSITLPNGAQLIQKVHLPGDVLGAPSLVLPRAADTLTAITQAVIAFVPFTRLGAIYSRLPRLGALFTFAAHVERLALMDKLAVKGRAAAKEQLAWLLLDLHARLTPLGAVENDEFDFPLTQEVVGDITGLCSIHVNRKMGELRREGLVAQKRRRLRILDLPALRALSPMRTRLLQFEPAWLPPPI